MKYCQYCGKELLNEAIFCPGCGCAVQTTYPQEYAVDNTVSAGLVVLSVLIPLFGIVYWPVKSKTRPKCAQACGIAAIIAWVFYIFIGMS
ncbi:MAG: zinc ribbon domain-containing protein [Oscillospiraceae bacterium]|nr:zinc ribbon domain-containing protein [Oscillospiraceae bacterium]